MRYLVCGYDPGTQLAGIAFLELDQEDPTYRRWAAVYEIQASGKHFPVRLAKVRAAVETLLALHRPLAFGYEDAYVKRVGPGINARAAIQLAKGIGSILDLLPKYELLAYECKAASLRKLLGNSKINYLGMRQLLQEHYPAMKEQLDWPKGVETPLMGDDAISAMTQAHAVRLMMQAKKKIEGINLVYCRSREKKKPATATTLPEKLPAILDLRELLEESEYQLSELDQLIMEHDVIRHHAEGQHAVTLDGK